MFDMCPDHYNMHSVQHQHILGSTFNTLLFSIWIHAYINMNEINIMIAVDNLRSHRLLTMIYPS